jgi:ubiquinone/menaquinone biosynthesis C-methylase UbiE
MDVKSHWENVYATKASDTVSWYRPHLDTSLALIEKIAAPRSTSLIDVGGGASTLVDDLLGHGYQKISVLDVSATAIEVAKRRLGSTAEKVDWIVGDITQVCLPSNTFDLWHDRAVFHFLRSQKDRSAYVRQVAKAVRCSGHALVGAFGPEGPTKCSGLDAMRYDAESLHAEFGAHFKLLESLQEIHQTPFGTKQQFVYCLCRVEASE